MASDNYAQDLHAFLLECPFVTTFYPLSVIGYMMFVDSEWGFEGNRSILKFEGKLPPIDKLNCLGENEQRNQVNFSLRMRWTIDDIYTKEEVSTIIPKIVNWINEQNSLRYTPNEHPKLPNFSNMRYDRMWADDGALSSIFTSGQNINVGEFLIGIHCEYDKFIKL